MKIFLVVRKTDHGYDEFESFVVVAESAEQALRTHPYGFEWDEEGARVRGSRTWVVDLDEIELTYLGDAHADAPKGVVCASFNAG